MAESSAIPRLQGLDIEAVEWLPSGADSGLVRVRGRWSAGAAVQPGLPELGLRAGGAEHRFESLPDARFARDAASWRGSYLVPGALVATEPDALWVEWPGGVRCGLPPLARGLATPPPAASEAVPEEPGGQLIDRAVLAERRARRAEAAERGQARVAAEALKAVEALELQSAELERRLAEAVAERDALADAAPPAGGARAASSVSRRAPSPDADAHARGGRTADELARLAQRRQAALESALDSLARLRAQSREWRLALRTSELERSGDAVRLAVLEAERALGDAGPRGALKARTCELAEERARVASLETVRQELEAALADARQQAADAGAELERARERADARLAAALAAADATREELERRRRGERAVHEEVRAELNERLEAAASRADALEAAQAELAADRDSARARAESLGARIAELEVALATAETGLATAEAAAATAKARLRVEAVARAALEAELDRARAAGDPAALAAALEAERAARAAERDALALERDPHASAVAEEKSAALEAERAARADAETALAEERSARAAADAALAEERSARAAADAALEAEREARAAAEAQLAAARSESSALRVELQAARSGFEADLAAEREARAAADAALAEALEATTRQGRTFQERIAELERGAAGLADEVRLADAAREQAEAAAAAAPPHQVSGRLVADLDAAAAALREAAPAEPPEAPREPAAADPPEAPAEPAAAPPPRVRPTIVSAAGPPPRSDATGRSAREYPRLRGAIVKLAHDDPAAAGSLLAALLPAQAAVLATPLDYDLTIAGTGTFAVTIDGPVARVERHPAPRGRGQRDFHLSADALTLAELLAGVDHRIGRWRGQARFSGSRRKLGVLRALAETQIGLVAAARAGADIEPALVYRTLPYAVHPSWTRGERFTLAQEITGARPETWYLSARDGAGITVASQPPEAGVEATVTMSRGTFAMMLRDEPVPSGERPVVRGDRRVVALVKAWMDRAQHGV